jgi:hypothetical protein
VKSPSSFNVKPKLPIADAVSRTFRGSRVEYRLDLSRRARRANATIVAAAPVAASVEHAAPLGQKNVSESLLDVS